jgi:hypothetical protein
MGRNKVLIPVVIGTAGLVVAGLFVARFDVQVGRCP